MNTAGAERNRTLGLYVHLPWCVRKCPYCDFNSHRAPREVPEDAYVDALLMDLDARLDDLPEAASRPLASIFIGGGTPSLFSAAAINRLLTAIGNRLNLTPDVEVTLEANPGTLEHDRFEAYQVAGVNRLSLGVQSFSPEALEALGRIHGPEEAHEAARLAIATFRRVNLDLMYGLPGQSLAEALADVNTALALDPGHLSHYQLTLEPNTPFASNPPSLPDEEDIEAMLADAAGQFAAAGYGHYEVSAWARPDQQCRHNLNYWRFGDYLGIGAGAHGKYTDGSGAWRFARQRHPRAYLQAPAEDQEHRRLSADDLVFEYFLNRLRLPEAVGRAEFEAGTGLAADCVQRQVGDLLQRGLLRSPEADDELLQLSTLGKRFLNDVMGAFLGPHDAAVEPPPRSSTGAAHRALP